MASLKASALALLLAGAGIGGAQAATLVTFDQPDSYTDASLNGDRGPTRGTLAQLDDYLQRLGNRYLKPGQTLKLTVLDIDLAGEYEPWGPYQDDIRFMRVATWPKITVRYVLEEGGQVRLAAEETVTDRDYLVHGGNMRTGDSLRYEKQMLEDWFKARFVAGRTPLS